jgi:hypothetical protein
VYCAGEEEGERGQEEGAGEQDAAWAPAVTQDTAGEQEYGARHGEGGQHQPGNVRAEACRRPAESEEDRGVAERRE